MAERVRELLARVGAFFGRTRYERDFDDEVATHMDMATDEQLREGVAPDEARRRAMARFGGRDAAREAHRDARGLPLLDQALLDLRYTFRTLWREPGFTLVAVASLALGIGLNTAIFSVVDGVLLRRAPLDQIDRTVIVWETDRNSGTMREPASVPDYLDFRERSRTIESLGALVAIERNLTPPDGDPIRLAALGATHEILDMSGIQPIAGRAITADDDRIGAPAVALISESLWTRIYERRPEAVGGVLRLDDLPYEIVGVMPDVSDFGVLQILGAAAYSRSFADRGTRVRVDVWLPFAPNPETLPRDTHPIFMVGRLAPGMTVAAAQAELDGIAADLEAEYPRANIGRGVHVEPLGDVVFGPVRPALLVLWAAVALVLLVAAVNVANLLLARGTARQREIAVRAALGSGGWRLARQFMVETIVLTAIAAAVGVALAYGGLSVLLAQAPSDIPRLESVGIDLRVLGLTVVVSVLVGLAFGLVPTLQALHVDPQTTLKGEGTRGTAGSRAGSRVRSALVIAETALAVLLVAGAGLLIRSFWQLTAVDAGFTAQGVLKAEYQLPPSRYPASFQTFPDFKEQHAFTQALLERTQALPGVESVAIAGNHPLDPGFTNSFSIVGRDDGVRYPEISVRRVTPGYFETVGLRLRRGRLLAETDGTREPPVALVNEAAVNLLFSGQDPIGQQINFWGANRTIVGVVADERFQGITTAAPIAAYLPLSQAPSFNGAAVVLVKGSGRPEDLAPGVRGAIRSVDPALAVFGVEPLGDTLARSIAEQRFTMLVLGVFAAMALVLAAIGVHGVLSYAVARRTPEFGIRLALGAEPSRLRAGVVLEGLVMAGAGVVLGLVGAAVLTRALASLLYGVTPTDPATFAGVAALLAIVAVVASLVPAIRATRIDPVAAIRAE
ncbi:MAG: ADOP family duplicated permease [Vicinamibacterales bacterium]